MIGSYALEHHKCDPHDSMDPLFPYKTMLKNAEMVMPTNEVGGHAYEYAQIDALKFSVFCIYSMHTENMPRPYPQVLSEFVVESAEGNATATVNMCAQV